MINQINNNNLSSLTNSGEDKYREFIQKLKNINVNSKEEVDEFRKKTSIEFFKEFFERLNKSGEWKGLEELINIISKNRKRKNRKQKIEIKIKYKDIEFNKCQLHPEPGKSGVLGYLLFSNDKIEGLIKEIIGETGRAPTAGFGIVILKDKATIEIKVGLQKAYGSKESGGEKRHWVKLSDYARNNHCLDIIDKPDNETFQSLVDKFNNNLKNLKKILEENKNSQEIGVGTKLDSIRYALKTKPFLILAGVSGTGKTQIARNIAGVMSNEEEKQEEAKNGEQRENSIDIQGLEKLIEKLDEEYSSDWKKIEGEFITKVEEISKHWQEMDEGEFFERVKKIMEFFGKPYFDVLVSEEKGELKKLLEKIKESYKPDIDPYSLWEEILNNKIETDKKEGNIKGYAISRISAWFSLFFHKEFIPPNERVLGRLVNDKIIKNFWDKTNKENIEYSRYFFKELGNIMKKKNFKTMHQIGYYFFKYNEEKGYI